MAVMAEITQAQRFFFEANGYLVIENAVTPEQLDSSLSSVTGGLAVAFDTTALSLGLSLVLVFCSFGVEKAEERILSAVEEYGLRRVGALFPAGSTVPTSFAAAEAEAAGFAVEDGREWSGTMRFADVATFVSYVRMVPWEVPEDFSVDRYAEALLAMTERDLVFTRRMFVLVCRRPGP